jgi:hypothetical protein
MIRKLITAIIEPIMVNQFFDAVGSFIGREIFRKSKNINYFCFTVNRMDYFSRVDMQIDPTFC